MSSYLDDFEALTHEIKHKLQAMEYALGNIEAMRTKRQDEIVQFMRQFDIVLVVWLYQNPAEELNLRMITIKEPEKVKEGMLFNAFPVYDEAEAQQWKALLNNEKSAPAVERKLLLVWNADRDSAATLPAATLPVQ
jgi:hypothetical protein